MFKTQPFFFNRKQYRNAGLPNRHVNTLISRTGKIIYCDSVNRIYFLNLEKKAAMIKPVETQSSPLAIWVFKRATITLSKMIAGLSIVD